MVTVSTNEIQFILYPRCFLLCSPSPCLGIQVINGFPDRIQRHTVSSKVVHRGAACSMQSAHTIKGATKKCLERTSSRSLQSPIHVKDFNSATYDFAGTAFSLYVLARSCAASQFSFDTRLCRGTKLLLALPHPCTDFQSSSLIKRHSKRQSISYGVWRSDTKHPSIRLVDNDRQHERDLLFDS